MKKLLLIITIITFQFTLAYQANIIGFRYGGIFGAFVEAGYGYKGILKFGLNIQL